MDICCISNDKDMINLDEKRNSKKIISLNSENDEINNTTADKFWSYLLKFGQNQYKGSSKEVIDCINLLFSFYDRNIDKNIKYNVFSIFLSTINPKFIQNSHDIDNFEKKIDEIIKQSKFYYFDILVHIALEQILDQAKFGVEFDRLLKSLNEKQNKKYYIQEILRFNDANSSNRVYFNKSMHFYIEKEYNNNIHDKDKKREIRIMKGNYSKFIISLSEKENDSNSSSLPIYPYYPIGTLESLFMVNEPNKNKIKLSLIDKIVITLEIANALKDLHSNNEYHGNISSHSVFIDSCKNAYLGEFCFTFSSDAEATKVGSHFYYRPGDQIAKITDDIEKVETYQSNDIYSFGVLMHEIFTEINPKKRMGNSPRFKRVQILSGNYSEFLFSGANNEIFDDNIMKGMSDVIRKCIKQNSNERWESFKELIETIKALPFYEQNKEEIEFRLEHANESNKYQCTLSDIVKSYYRGQTLCKNDIESFLSTYEQIANQEIECATIIKGDMIKTMLDTFHIKSITDYSFSFHAIFNYIILECFKRSYFQNQVYYEEDQLFSLSIAANSNKKMLNGICQFNFNNISNHQNIDFIIPVCSLDEFVKNNPGKYEKYGLIWIYEISKELNVIHSLDLYIGELDASMIGLYYNNDTNMLCPSLILYYFFNKVNQKTKIQKHIHDQYLSRDEIIEKYQRKDIKQIKIIAKNLGINSIILSKIEKCKSMNIIVFILYNILNKESTNVFNDSMNDYSSFQITFPRMKKVYNLIQTNGYSIKNFILSLANSLLSIRFFTENTKSNLSYPITRNIAFEEKETQDDINDIEKIMIDINSNCYLINEECEKMIIERNDEHIQHKNDLISQLLYRHIHISKYTSNRMLENKQKIENLKTKPVYINLEFIALYKKSFNYLLRRTIMNLNPKVKYRIKIIFNTPKSILLNFEKITIQDVQMQANVTGRLNSPIYETENKNGFYFYLNNIE